MEVIADLDVKKKKKKSLQGMLEAMPSFSTSSFVL